MIDIKFLDIENNKDVERVAIQAAQTALVNHEGDITVAFCQNEYIQGLNAHYRGLDKPTDVLSFESEEIDPESGRRYLGDIVISLPQAVKQAGDAGNLLTSEVAMLVVHGVLHLLGHDHQTPDEKTEMWKKQYTILASMGIKMDKFSGDE
jgi:probable rRNA maturation factor